MLFKISELGHVSILYIEVFRGPVQSAQGCSVLNSFPLLCTHSNTFLAQCIAASDEESDAFQVVLHFRR